MELYSHINKNVHVHFIYQCVLYVNVNSNLRARGDQDLITNACYFDVLETTWRHIPKNAWRLPLISKMIFHAYVNVFLPWFLQVGVQL